MNVDVAWLAIALIVVLTLDAAACAKPITYIKNDLDRLGCTPGQINIIPVVKLLAVAGLIVGLWAPIIGAAACTGMIVYFGFAFGFHARASDPIPKYLPAAGFMVFVIVVLVVSYLPAIDLLADA